MGNSIIIEAELVSGSEQVLEIGLDSAVLEKGLTNITGLLSNLQATVVRVATAISCAFTVGFQKMETALNALKLSAGDVTRSIEDLQTSLNDGVDVGGIIDNIVSIGASIVSILTTKEIGEVVLPALSAAFMELGRIISTALEAIAAATGLSVGAVVAIAATVIAAITAIVVFWDEISVFFTDTLPAALSQAVQWLNENAGPVGETLGEIVSGIGTTFADVLNLFQQIGGLVATIGDVIKNWWDSVMQILAVISPWIMQYVINPIVEKIMKKVSWLSELFSGIIQSVKDVFYNYYTFFIGLWNTIIGIWGKAKNMFFSYIVLPVTKLVTDLANGICSIIANIKDGFMDAIKKVVNIAIDYINSRISIPFEGVNQVIKLIRGIEIVGLNPFAGLKTINVPQIPHLARGAVLPANRPFLAVVGDQRHGTNIEAPLATIQEAVAAVMGDHISAMMAGFEALLQEQQATRRTIENIEIGDTVIGQAADRYNSKMAVICGR